MRRLTGSLVLILGIAVLLGTGGYLWFAPPPKTGVRGTVESTPSPQTTPLRLPAPERDRPQSGLFGRVVDELGNPLSGITVTAVREEEAVELLPRAEIQVELASATTDVDGQFDLEPKIDFPMDSQLALVADHPHFPPQVVRRRIPSPGEQAVDLGDLILSAGPGLVVEVRAAHSGLSVPAARVRLQPALQDVGLPAFAVDLQTRDAITDDRGEAVFYGVAAGPWQLVVQADGLATALQGFEQSAAPSAPPRTIVRMAQGHTLSGRVLNADGSPLTDAWVQCRPMVEDSTPALEARTRANGEFSIPGVSGDLQRLTVESYTGGTQSRARVEPTEFQTLIMPAGQEVSGRVVEEGTGDPVPAVLLRAQVGADWPTLREGRIYRPSAETAPDGTFRITGLPDGTVSLTATATGYTPTEIEVPSSDATVTIELRRGFTVSGTVMSPAGTPVVGVLVRGLHDRGDRIALPGIAEHVIPQLGLPQVRTGDGGFFALTFPIGGPYRVLVQSTEAPPLVSKPVTAISTDRLDLGTLILVPGGTVFGVAELKSGKPAAGATVYMIPEIGLPAALAGTKARCDDQGQFHLPPVAPGTYLMFYDFPDVDPPAVAANRRAATKIRVHVEDRQELRENLRPIIR